MASNFNSNSSVSEPPIDLLNSQQEQQQVSQQEQQQVSQQEQQQVSQQEQQQVSQQEQQPDPQSEATEEDGEGVVEEGKDSEEADDKDEEPEQTEDEDNSNSNSQGNFFEENKSLLTKVYKILKLKFPSLNISLSELLTAAQKHIDMYANNPGHGGGVGVAGEGDEPKPEIDLSQFNDKEIDEIVNGFCKIYSTDYNTFHQKIVSKETNINNLDYDYHANQYPPNLTKELCDILNNRDCTDRFKEELHQQEIIRVKKLNKALNDIVDSMNKDVSLRLKPKEALTKYCLKDAAVLDYIEYLLKIYFDKWLLPDGSGDRFPYVINKSYNKIGNQDIGPRSGKYVIDEKDQNVKDSKVIKTEWDSVKNYIQYYKNNNNDCCKFYQDNKWKFERFISLNNEDDEKIELYYKQEGKTEKYTPEDDGNYIKYKNEYKENSTTNFQWFKLDESSTKKETFDLQLYSMKLSKIKEDKYYSDDGVDCNCEGGKGSVLFMQKVASSLLERFNNSEKQGLEKFFSNRYKHVYEANKNEAKKISYRFKDYLHDLGIGMDCSGYVPRALAFVMSELMIPGHEQIKTLGPAYGRLKTNMSTLSENDHSILVEKKVKKTITVGKETYEIRDVSNIHPGDITVNSSHIRIICEVDKNNNYFRVHESGSQGIKDSLREKERIGIIQTKVFDWIEKEPYTWEENNEIITSYFQKIEDGSYLIRRPSAFSNPDKLRDYFINMLRAKGKGSN